MNFDFTQQQHELRDAAETFLAERADAVTLRTLWEAPDRTSYRDLWRSAAEVGLFAVTVDEEHGGLGLGDVDLVLLLEEVGRAALAGPFLETTAVAAPLLVRAGTDEQRAGWLPGIAAGDVAVALQLAPDDLVADADSAELLLCRRGDVLRAVPRERVQVAAQPTSDPSRPLFAVQVDPPRADERLGGPAEAQEAADRAAAACAAVLNGVASRLVAMTLRHVVDREQFGRPIGAFQAVKHKLVDAHMRVQMARPAAWHAAYLHDVRGSDASLASRIAKAAAAEAAALSNLHALQLHGGIGFTWDHDLHLWLKRGKALERAYGSSRHHRLGVAASLTSGVAA